MQFSRPPASHALFGQRMLLRAMVSTDPNMSGLEVIDLTTERDTTEPERAYAIRLQSFIAASAATLQGASA